MSMAMVTGRLENSLTSSTNDEDGHMVVPLLNTSSTKLCTPGEQKTTRRMSIITLFIYYLLRLNVAKLLSKQVITNWLCISIVECQFSSSSTTLAVVIGLIFSNSIHHVLIFAWICISLTLSKADDLKTCLLAVVDLLRSIFAHLKNLNLNLILKFTFRYSLID